MFIQPLAPPGRVLDLGAWTGATGVSMSNAFPDATVWLVEPVDACKFAIKRTIALFANHPERCLVQTGDHLEPPLPSDLDLVCCGEVLEHVPDVQSFIAAVEASCAPGALVVFTTPIQVPDDHPARVHCRNLELEDLTDLFGMKRGFRLTRTRSPAHHVFCWAVDGSPTGEIDWRRKLKRWGFE